MKQSLLLFLLFFSSLLNAQSLDLNSSKPIHFAIETQKNDFSKQEALNLVKAYFDNYTEIKNGISIPQETTVKIWYPMQVMPFTEIIKYDLQVQFKENRHRIVLTNFSITNTFKSREENLISYYGNTKKRWKKKIKMALNDAELDAIQTIQTALKTKKSVESNDDW